MAPEQTGRMNRSIDSRSDLYSLGVTLYEMLTGSLPFAASDPMEWVHCHIARQPAAPSERLPNVPAAVSAITMKLLSKTAEGRYQTAGGVERDLLRCLSQWESRGSIDLFTLGAQDTPDRLMIAEKLYGRDREVDALLTAFDRIVAGDRPELVLVSGYSGICKSAVVNELHKPLVPPRGLFASGKFDQYKRDIPYATLAQAFQSLVRPLLSRGEDELCKWRNALREALDPNGLLIVELVPELKHVIGEQPPVSELPPTEAQQRFQLVFRRFIGVFATPEHTLALFLDDLQWLDAATLDLLEDLLTRDDRRHLLLIGAYRDNEVSATHPLVRKLDAIRQAGAAVEDIVLTPLGEDDLHQLLVDSLRCEPGRAAALAKLIHDKTTGNPFFAIQFISTLAEEGLLRFDYGEGRWEWDLNRIHAKGYTDNVVELMVGKLNRLPADTQEALKQFASIGNSAGFDVLAMAHEKSLEELHQLFWEGVRTGLISRSDDSYRFLHDRVQEAAYSLTPKEQRAEAHLRIGMLLAEHTPAERREEAIFEIVNQLNRGSHLITSVEDRERVADLNLIAGRRAKLSTAYDSALKYLRAGRALLTEETWECNYRLIFSIEYLMAECELLTADKGAAESRLSSLAQRATNRHDFCVATRLRLTLYTTLDRSDLAVDVFLDWLRRDGTVWSNHPTREDVMREYERIWVLLGRNAIEELVDLPLITNPDVLDTLDVFTEIMTPSQLFDEHLSTCSFATLLQHPASPVSHFVVSSIVRRALMGLAAGATVVAIIMSPWGKQSGGHFNPAMTVAFYRLGKIARWDASFYGVAQFLGAISGVAMATLLLRGAPGDGAVRYAVTAGVYGWAVAFAAELAISFLLMITVLLVTNHQRLAPYTPYFVGSLYAVNITFETPLSGMSMNPARTFGPAAYSGYWHSLWIYFVAPTLGMLAAAAIFLRARHGKPAYCAKLRHANNKRCIFNHGPLERRAASEGSNEKPHL